MTNTCKLLDPLWKRGTEFLGTRYAILGGAMTWVSDRHLVSAISNAGGFGVLACGAMTPDLLKKEILATREKTSLPFGVNLITLHPQLFELIDVCLETGISHVVLAGGVPAPQAIAKLKEADRKVMCFTPALSLGKRLIRQGIDALIIEGSEAGGHIGPVSTNVLAQEILPQIREVPVFVAGGIGRGESILSYLEMGAAGCQLGTRFVCAYEANVHPNFKQAFIRAAARDAIVSVQLDPRFPVIPVRSLNNNGIKMFMETQRELAQQVNESKLDLKEAQLKIEHFWVGALRRAAVEGDVKNGSVMAGQSVGLVNKEQSTSEIMEELIFQAVQALQSRPRT